MARIRDINDIDEDEQGQIVDYSVGDSNDGNKSKEDLPEETFRRHLDTSQPLQYSILREGQELLHWSGITALSHASP